MSSFGHLHPNATEILDETLPPRAPVLTNHALFLQALTHIEPLRFHHLALCMVKSCYNIYVYIKGKWVLILLNDLIPDHKEQTSEEASP